MGSSTSTTAVGWLKERVRPSRSPRTVSLVKILAQLSPPHRVTARLEKNRQTAEGGGFGAAYDGVGQNPVVECDVDAVVVAVECHRLHVDVSVYQLRAAGLSPAEASRKRLGLRVR